MRRVCVQTSQIAKRHGLLQTGANNSYPLRRLRNGALLQGLPRKIARQFSARNGDGLGTPQNLASKLVAPTASLMQGGLFLLTKQTKTTRNTITATPNKKNKLAWNKTVPMKILTSQACWLKTQKKLHQIFYQKKRQNQVNDLAVEVTFGK